MSADKASRRARRRRNLVTLPRVQQALGEAIEQIEFYILDPAREGERIDVNELCKLTHALAQAAGVFKTLTEAGALEEVEALTARLGELGERVHAIESDASRLSA